MTDGDSVIKEYLSTIAALMAAMIAYRRRELSVLASEPNERPPRLNTAVGINPLEESAS